MISRLRQRAAAALGRDRIKGDRTDDVASRVAELSGRVEELRPPVDLLVEVLHRAEQRLDRIEAAAERTDARLSTHSEQLGKLGELGDALRGLRERIDRDVWPILYALAAEEAPNRRRVRDVRAAPGYEDAYTAAEPLVSVIVPTRDRLQLLMERSLPSILAQTYRHLEVIVVGDRAGRAVGEALDRLGDDRVRYVDLPQRIVHPDPERRWLAAATMARNEGYQQASGAWMLDFDDDDTLRPDAVERLLALARSSRAEVVHADFDQHAPDGAVTRLGGDPPEPYRSSLAAALVHSGMRVFERQLFAADLGVPGDWFRTERMLRAGVRFAHLDAVVFDYYPTSLWGGRPAP